LTKICFLWFSTNDFFEKTPPSPHVSIVNINYLSYSQQILVLFTTLNEPTKKLNILASAFIYKKLYLYGHLLLIQLLLPFSQDFQIQPKKCKIQKNLSSSFHLSPKSFLCFILVYRFTIRKLDNGHVYARDIKEQRKHLKNHFPLSTVNYWKQ